MAQAEKTVDMDAVEAKLKAAGFNQGQFEQSRFECQGVHAVAVRDSQDDSVAVYEDGIVVIGRGEGIGLHFLLLAMDQVTDGLVASGLRAHADLNDWEVFRDVATSIEEQRDTWKITVAEHRKETGRDLLPSEVVEHFLQLIPVAYIPGDESADE